MMNIYLKFDRLDIRFLKRGRANNKNEQVKMYSCRLSRGKCLYK